MAGEMFDESACATNSLPVPAKALEEKVSHCSEMVHVLPPERMSASASEDGPVARLAVSHRIGDRVAVTLMPVMYGCGLTSRLMELSDAVKDGQNWPSWMGMSIVDAVGDALVAEAMIEPDSDGADVLKTLCAAELPDTVGEDDSRTVHVPSAAPAAELVVLVEIDGA